MIAVASITLRHTKYLCMSGNKRRGKLVESQMPKLRLVKIILASFDDWSKLYLQLFKEQLVKIILALIDDWSKLYLQLCASVGK
jgi:hypothetical protein